MKIRYNKLKGKVLAEEKDQSNNVPVDVVLAEDDPFISRMYTVKLQSSGLNIVLARSGRAAVEAITKNQPRLVMLDINMPELTGFEVYDVLKNNHYDWSRSEVIFLTNSSKKEDVDRANKLGCDYIIKSDSTPKEVLEKIESKLKK